MYVGTTGINWTIERMATYNFRPSTWAIDKQWECKSIVICSSSYAAAAIAQEVELSLLDAQFGANNWSVRMLLSKTRGRFSLKIIRYRKAAKYAEVLSVS